MTWSKKKCIRCGKTYVVHQFANGDEYLAFECIACGFAWRVIYTGEIEVIRGYIGSGIEDFDLVGGVLIIGDEEPI